MLDSLLQEFQKIVKMSYGGGQKVQKVMVQPSNLVFRYLQSVWLYDNVNTRIEGHIVGSGWSNRGSHKEEDKEEARENHAEGV